MDSSSTDFFSLDRVVAYFPQILSKLPVTLNIVLWSLALGLLLALVIAAIRIFKVPVLNQLSSVFISFTRGTPQIVQVFLVFYGLPALLSPLFSPLGVNLNHVDATVFVIITFALAASASLAVMFVGAYQAVDKGQVEAALSIGMMPSQLFRRVIVPQALVIAIPEFGNNTVALLKGTSVAFTVGVIDMLGIVSSIGARTYHFLEGYVGAAIIYLVLCLLLGRIFALLERRFAIYR